MKFASAPAGMGRVLAIMFLISACLDTAAQELPDAAKAQDWVMVQSLLEQKNVDVDQSQADGATALAWAVYWDELNTAGLLIAAGANPDAVNYIGVSPLLLAVKNRSAEMAGLLLRAGADPASTTWSGITPLMTAAGEGETAIVGLLLEHGADIDAREPRRGQNALMWAISFEHPDTARVLIERGADVSAGTSKLKEAEEYHPMLMRGYGGNVEGIAQGGYTPLMFAARNGDMATAALLLEHGADINDVSNEDGTALVIATARGYEDMAYALLERGADPTLADANGMTALHYTMRDGLKMLHGFENVAVTRVCGFNWDTLCKSLETITEEEKTSLQNPLSGLYVVEAEKDSAEYERRHRMILPGGNMYDLAEALLARGADVNAAMKFPPARLRLDTVPWLNLAGATPFLLATAALDEAAMGMLLEHGADPTLKTEVNQSVFMEQTTAIADDNQVLGNGSPFLVAVGLGRKDPFTESEEKMALGVASRLLDLGADVNEATATGWTPLHAAAYIGSAPLVKLLVENGAVLNARNGCGRTPLSLAEAESNVGLIRRFRANETMAQLLRDLGAGEESKSRPVGECVLGRFQY